MDKRHEETFHQKDRWQKSPRKMFTICHAGSAN